MVLDDRDLEICIRKSNVEIERMWGWDENNIYLVSLLRIREFIIVVDRINVEVIDYLRDKLWKVMWK